MSNRDTMRAKRAYHKAVARVRTATRRALQRNDVATMMALTGVDSFQFSLLFGRRPKSVSGAMMHRHALWRAGLIQSLI